MKTKPKKEYAISKLLCKVDTSHGAQMGRASYGNKPKGVKIYDRKVNLHDGAYDKGGAYWGTPNNVRVEFTKDLSYVRFYRTEK